MTNSMTVRLLGVVVVMAVFGFSSGCRQNASSESQTPRQVEVTVATPLVQPIVEWDHYTGRLSPIDSVEIRARVSGYLQSTHFAEGQIVSKGDLLAIIDPRPFEAAESAAAAMLRQAEAGLKESQAVLRQANAEVADAEAQLRLAEQRYERALTLLERNAGSKDEADIRESEKLQAIALLEASRAKVESASAGIATATAAIETAKANVVAAELDLQYTEIRAPISGRISRRVVTAGNLISGGTNQSTLLTTIVTLDPIHCYFDANEQDFLKYARLAREGKRESSRAAKNPVFAALVDEVGFPHAGHMDFVDNQLDPNTGTMRGRAILANDDGILTPGLFMAVRIPGSGSYDAVLIPDSAIGSDQSENFVYVVDGTDNVQRRVVTLGPISHGLRVIRSGLDGSERVVTRGLQLVSPGLSVMASEESLTAGSDGGLPDNYAPVPEGEWLSRPPDDVPVGIEPNALQKSDGTDPADPGGEQKK